MHKEMPTASLFVLLPRLLELVDLLDEIAVFGGLCKGSRRADLCGGGGMERGEAPHQPNKEQYPAERMGRHGVSGMLDQEGGFSLR